MQAYAGREAHCRLRSLAHAAAVRRNPITAGALRGVNSETVRWTVSGRGQRLHSSRGKNYFAFKFWGRNNSSGVPNGNAAPARESLPYGKTLAFPPVRACVRNSIVKTLRLRASLRSWLTPHQSCLAKMEKFSIDPFSKGSSWVVAYASIRRAGSPLSPAFACARCRSTAKSHNGRRSERGEFRNSPVDCFWKRAATA